MPQDQNSKNDRIIHTDSSQLFYEKVSCWHLHNYYSNRCTVDAPDIDYIHCVNKQIWFHLLQNDSTGSQYYRSDFKTKLDLCAVWTKALNSDVLTTTLFDFSHFAAWWICFKRFPLPFFCCCFFMSKQTFKSIIFKKVPNHFTVSTLLQCINQEDNFPVFSEICVMGDIRIIHTFEPSSIG